MLNGYSGGGGSSSSTATATGRASATPASDLVLQSFDANSPTIPMERRQTTNGAAAQRPKSSYQNVFEFQGAHHAASGGPAGSPPVGSPGSPLSLVNHANASPVNSANTAQAHLTKLLNRANRVNSAKPGGSGS